MIKKQVLARFGKNFWLITSLIVASLSSSVVFAKVPDSLDLLLKRGEYRNVNVSPSGQYISLINRVDDRNTLIVLDRETMKPIPRKSVRYEEKTNMDVRVDQKRKWPGAGRRYKAASVLLVYYPKRTTKSC